MVKYCDNKVSGDHQNVIDLSLLDIPERTYNYTEYRDRLVSDDFDDK